MNTKIMLACGLVFSTLGFSALATPPIGTSLITDDGAQYHVENLSTDGIDIAQKLKDAMESGKADNLIFYVHGRGKEPKKSLQKVIPDLEKEYRSAVLMFHWFPSWKGPTGYPDQEAEAAAQDLGKALKYYQAYKKQHPDEFKKLKSTLIVHSMGNIAFAEFMKSYTRGTLDSGLFDTIVLSSPDVDANGHDKWVGKIDFANAVYITLNEHDGVLGWSAKHAHKKRLGQLDESTKTITGTTIPLAQNANYVDVSEANVNHRYFLRSGQEDNRWLRQFFDSVMNGIPVNLKNFPGVARVTQGNGNVIYVLKGE